MHVGLDPASELGFEEVDPSTEADLIAVVMRCKDASGVVAGSQRKRCSRCGFEVWVAPATPGNGTLVCTRCFSRMVKTPG